MRGFLTRLVRLHLRPLRAHPAAVASAVLGVAVGTALVVATQLLTASLTAPFESIPTALGADGDLIEVRPVVADRLRNDLVDEVAAIAGVAGTARLALQPTVARNAGAETDLLLVAVEADDGVLPDLVRPGPGRNGPLPAPCDDAPDALAVALTDPAVEALFPDRPADADGCVTFGATARPIAPQPVALAPDAAERLQGGRVGFAAPATVQGAEGADPFWTVAYVQPSGDRDAVIERLQELVGDRATVGDPQPTIPPAIVTVRDALGSLAAGGAFIGALIAFNTLVLVVGARIPSLATAIALGATRRSVLGGVVAEGAVVGFVGGALAIPLGLGLGRFLVDRFGTSILDGAGVDLALRVDPIVLAGAPSTGTLIGGLATFFAARRPLRRPLDHLGGAVDRTPRGRVPRWLGPAGLVLVTVATVLMVGVGSGTAPVVASQAALVWGAFGIALLTTAVAPSLAGALLRRRERRDAAAARIARAEVQRTPVRIAMIVSTVGLSAGMAAAFAGLAELAPATLADGFVRQLGDQGRLTTAQRPWDPRFATLAPASAMALAAQPPDGASVRFRSYLPSETEPRLVMALAPDADAVRRHLRADDAELVAQVLAAGDVALTGIASERLGAGVGDRVELPTIEGIESFRVGAVVEVGLADDTTIGDWVVAAATRDTFRRWAPAPELIAADRAVPVPDSARTYGATDYRDATRGGIGRYFQPFALTGWVFLLAAALAVGNFLLLALATRARERATLAVIGADDRVERRAVLTQAAVQTVLAVGVYLVSVLAFTGWLALSSPAFYGFRLSFGVATGPLLIGLVLLVDGLVLAAARPWVAATVTDPTPALRGE